MSSNKKEPSTKKKNILKKNQKIKLCKKKETVKKINKNNIINEYITVNMNTYITKKTLNKVNLNSKEVNEFKKNLKNDIKNDHKKIKKKNHKKINIVHNKIKNDKIFQLSDKDIINMIKND